MFCMAGGGSAPPASGFAPPARSKPGPVGACPWATEAVAFKRWVTDAVSLNGSERAELYTFLAECFKDADTDRDGFVNPEEFDFLVEKAAALPRRFGLAPSWKTLYGDVATRERSRAWLFQMVDKDHKNSISIDNWIQYAFKHITEKVEKMPTKTLDFQNLPASGKSGFLKFLRTAVSDEASAEFQELYQFLFKNFVIADTDQKGSVTFEQFDHLVELSATAPRSLGLAPPTDQMFKSTGERKAARKKLFDSMDSDKGGTISFDEYLKYTLEHIAGKVEGKDAEEAVVAVPAWQTTASAFGPWVCAAIERQDSQERRELYTFLCDCFMDADADRDGFVSSEEFDFLCEKAATLPRRFGLAPNWRDLYGTVEGRQAARGELFKKVDSSKRGKIGIDDWIQYAFKHIGEKVKTMQKDTVDFSDLPKTGKGKFLAFLKTATSDKKSRENTELYQFLFNNFVLADKEAKGAVTLEQFDTLVELSAAAPRALGLAPKSSEMFASDAERLAARKKLFGGMDRDKGGTITFDEYLKYTMGHIAEKVQNSNSEGDKCPMGFS